MVGWPLPGLVGAAAQCCDPSCGQMAVKTLASLKLLVGFLPSGEAASMLEASAYLHSAGLSFETEVHADRD